MAQKYKVFCNNKLNIINDNWSSFCKAYKIIYASGGVVLNDNNELLMIYRNGVWDLPKGKNENNESNESCALREVKEECGINKLSVTKYLKETYHTYQFENEKILKITSWFLMFSNRFETLHPQKEEGISKVQWIKKKDLQKVLKNSYANIVDLLEDINYV